MLYVHIIHKDYYPLCPRKTIKLIVLCVHRNHKANYGRRTQDDKNSTFTKLLSSVLFDASSATFKLTTILITRRREEKALAR